MTQNMINAIRTLDFHDKRTRKALERRGLVAEGQLTREGRAYRVSLGTEVGEGWAIVVDEAAAEAAAELARGDYQQNLLSGYEALSGSTLRGRARTYSARYAASRAALLERCAEAGIRIGEVTREHGKRVLVIG